LRFARLSPAVPALVFFPKAVSRRLIFALLCGSTLPAQQVTTSYGITVRYPADFAGHSWKQEPKLTQQEIGTDIPDGVAPLRPVLHLKSRLLGRADDNTIEVIPLRDRSVADFSKAYPGLSSSMTALKALLGRPQLPGMKALEKADPVIVDAAYSLCARVERVEGSWLSGFMFLAQFTQEESGDLPNNSELTYEFLGITKDGAFLVEATFAVSHASLPWDGVYATARKLRESERQLATLDEDSFQPPLSRLKAILRSMASAR
jgi:hypothetical protein